MPTILRSGTIHVFTFKAGVLSRVAHDLRFSLKTFELALADAEVHGRFWPDSLEVCGVMKNDTLDASALGGSDKTEITHTLRTKVLHTKQFPEVRLQAHVSPGTGEREVAGTLELVGRSHPIAFTVLETNGTARGEVRLEP